MPWLSCASGWPRGVETSVGCMRGGGVAWQLKAARVGGQAWMGAAQVGGQGGGDVSGLHARRRGG